MYGMLLGKLTRTRSVDTIRRAFFPRFVNGQPGKAWKMVRELEDRNLPVEILRPVYYWLTARNEPLLYDFVTEELLSLSKIHPNSIAASDVAPWITSRLSAHNKAWSPTVTTKVARGVLAALRDFGILEGAVKKKIAPVYIPVESFAFVAFALHQEGASGSSLLIHPDWSLFLFSPSIVEQMVLEADRNHLLRFQAAGRIVRIDFPANSFREMADVIAARSFGRST